MPLDTFPRELIIHILQFLTLSDRKAVGLTCTYLYEATLDLQLLQNVSVVICDNLNAAVNIYKYSRLPIQHLVLKEIEIQTETISGWKEFWENIGRNLISLALHNCDISERSFVEVILYCPKLQSLQLNRSDSIFMSGNLLENEIYNENLKDALKNLSEIKLNNNRYLTDALFNRLMVVMPKIEKLSLAGCQISFHPAIYKRFYPAHRENTPSDSVFTFQNVLKYINAQRTKFRSLNLSQTIVDGNSLTALAHLKDLNLQELYLAHCEQINSASISTLCSMQTKLLVLDLSYSSKITDHALNAICEHLRKLQHLYLRSCELLSEISTSALWKLSSLKTLNLSSCKQVATIGILNSLSETTFSNLRTLNLSASFIDENTIITIAEKLTNLFYLDLSSCRLGVKDFALRAICSNLRNLRTLHVAWCDEVSDYGLGHYGIIYEDQPSTSTHKVVGSDSLSNLQSLRNLDLCACSKITDGAVNTTIRFTELQSLNLSLCKNITDKAIACLGLFNPSLETLLLSQCHLITDDGVINMVGYLPRLKHLDLQGCKMLTNACLYALGRCCLNLQYLDVSICPGITQDGIDVLESTLHAPHTIHKRHIQPKEFL